MLYLLGSCFEVDWPSLLLRLKASFREGFGLQDMVDPYKIHPFLSSFVLTSVKLYGFCTSLLPTK